MPNTTAESAGAADVAATSSPALKRVPGGANWNWLAVYVDGADLVVRHVDATRFGSPDDKEDNGIGASGFSTHTHPDYLGVSLPQAGRGIRNMADCPIPRLPWYTPVKVYSEETGEVAYGHLIDLGPSLRVKHGLDMTNALVKALGLTLAAGVYKVSYRVIGGAAFLKSK